jgi:hypothetical protein
MMMIERLILAAVVAVALALAVAAEPDAPFAVLERPGDDRIEFYSSPGPHCRGPGNRVVWQMRDSPDVALPYTPGQRIEGCWIEHDGVVYMGFMDGTQYTASPRIFGTRM